MNFALDDEILVMKKNIREFIQHEVEAAAMRIEEENQIPDYIIKLSKELGLFGLSIPEEYGGLGIGMVGKCALYEEIGQTHNGYTTLIGAHTGIGTVGIVEMGNELQKRKYLPEMASGERIGAFALTEPEAGSNAANLKTTAVRKGDRYLLNGIKHYITNATEASVFTVMAVTEPDKGAKGITSFIVEKDFAGFSVGKKEKKLGIRSSPTTEIIFEDCKVPLENRLGEEGDGFKIAMMTLDGGRNGIAAQAVGIAQGALDAAVDYARERHQFGKPIAANQGISFKLADMATSIEASRLLTYQAAWLESNGLPYGKESAMSKLFAGDTAMKVTTEAVQVFGGYGYTKDYPVERFMRDAKITQIYEGTQEIQRLVISRMLTK
ncbi:acyl-CoA dehydrogenase family protein [Bacillus sp. JJ1764]|uniref:acyl-CoA dehydrogenase family protein n=1 Tax=Bacillus sp. JJ1764 TaxID=3122964 RepID=UPI002FFF7574